MLTKSSNRPALIAWSQHFETNQFIAVAEISNKKTDGKNFNSNISIFDLSYQSFFEAVSIEVKSSFERIIWTSLEGSSKDLIVGSFNDGRIELYDTKMLLNGEKDGVIEVPKLHSGAVKGLCSSIFQPNLIATGAANGEIALWDLNNIQKAALIPFKKCEKFENVSNLVWNPKVSHIIAAASYSGVVSIIDLRSKKELATIFLPNSAQVSALSWNPEIPTSIAIASSSNSQPDVYLWDLRNTSSPKDIFKGHSKGVNSLEWCPKDSKMILSAGNDSNVLCWNPESNEIIKEYHDKNVVDVKWCPSNPNIIGMSTLTSIEIHSINDYERDKDKYGHVNCKSTPNWFTCPISAAFGGYNTCSILNSGNQMIKLVKPRIDSISSKLEKLLNFEDAICRRSLVEAFNHTITEDLNNSCLKTACNLLRSASSPKSHENLLEFIEEIRFSQDFLIEANSNNSDKPTLIPESSAINSEKVHDKILKCDYEAAMFEYLKAGCFTEAYLIASCGGNDLQIKAEKYLMELNYCFSIDLVLSVSRGEFKSLVSKGPICEWYVILKALLENADSTSLDEAVEIFSRRLLENNFNKHALVFVMAAGNLEQFLEIIVGNLATSFSISEISAHELAHVIFVYQLVRILEYLRPNIVKNLKSVSLKITVFEMTTKLKYILHSFGFKAEIANNFFEKDFYGLHLHSKNSELDILVENLIINKEINNLDRDVHYNFEKLSLSPSVEPKNESDCIQSSPNFNRVQYFFSAGKSQENNQKLNYNDVPLFNTKLSKLSPQMSSTEVRSEDVCVGLKALFDYIESKSTLEFKSRIVQDCMKKLNTEYISSKQYSDPVKPFIASLFIELSANQFENSALLASNILASFFAETKDWILPIKRLIEIAKSQK